MIVRRAVDGVDERLDATSFVKRNLRKVFPDHWSFMLGELALYSFVLLILTGIFLSFFYVASSSETVYLGPYAPMHGQTVSQAYGSVLRLSFEVRAGLVMRQTHHWAAYRKTWPADNPHPSDGALHLPMYNRGPFPGNGLPGPAGR